MFKSRQSVVPILVLTMSLAWSGGRCHDLYRYDASSLAGHRVVKSFDLETEGMFYSSVQSIFEDQNGRIWAGTGSGCAVLNQQETAWELYTPNSVEMVEGGVRMMAESDDHKLWFAPRPFGINNRNRGITCFDGERWSTINEANSPLPSRTSGVQAMFGDNLGKLWLFFGDRLISYSHGLWTLEGTLTKLFHLPKGASVNAAIEDKQGHLWLAGPGYGVARVDIVSMRAELMNPMQLIRYPKGWSDELEKNEATFATCLYEDREGRIWTAAGNYVYAYDRGANLWQGWDLSEYVRHDLYTRSVCVNSIYEDRTGTIMLATSVGLLTKSRIQSPKDVPMGRFTRTSNPLIGDVAESVMEDRKGRIWVGGLKLVVLEP